jgi:hypothetical protein
MRTALPAFLLMLLGAGVTVAQAQIAPGRTIGPGGVPMAPGPSQPRDFTPGGIGPGGVKVAPGRAARDVDIEREGPGGTRLAPGRAGRVGTGTTAGTQVIAPSSGDLSRTIKVKKRKIYRGKAKRRGRPDV